MRRAMIDLPQLRVILASAAAVLAAAALSGCGQTGALYLPQLPPGGGARDAAGGDFGHARDGRRAGRRCGLGAPPRHPP